MKFITPFLLLLQYTFITAFKEECYTVCPVCEYSLDIVMVIDKSNSIKKNEYTNIIEFTNNFVDEFEVGENKTRFGAVSFATTIENEFQLTDYYNASSIKYHFDTIMTKSGNGIWTNTPEAIDLVRTNILLKGRNKTTSVVLITDGSPKLKNKSSKSMRILTRTAIKKLRLDYPWVNIYSVGIGMKKSGKNLLKQISDTNNVFNVDDFSDLSTILNNVTDALCI